MIRRLTNPYTYSAQEQVCIQAANNNWESGRNCVKTLKELLNKHFDHHQNDKCCYCGLEYGRTGRGEVDHIAPKGNEYYPQFSFTPNNLAKACQLCNSSTMKHTYDSIDTLDPIYENCTFKIVHPYLDDHSLHFKFSYGLLGVLISVENNSAKGLESIGLFELDSEKRTRARATERNQARLEAIYRIPAAIKERIRSVLTFKL
ncbi:hypothetical protein LWM68_08485 [Niabella sp. W65]|nr:hypothetical protein [Niabella sp. W65]MCH7362800.1 hypothetical protein [Niabella sp. W65]